MIDQLLSKYFNIRSLLAKNRLRIRMSLKNQEKSKFFVKTNCYHRFQLRHEMQQAWQWQAAIEPMKDIPYSMIRRLVRKRSKSLKSQRMRWSIRGRKTFTIPFVVILSGESMIMGLVEHTKCLEKAKPTRPFERRCLHQIPKSNDNRILNMQLIHLTNPL